MSKRVLIFLLLYCLPAVLFAGTTGKIEGVVKDSETGEPLPGVNVIIEGTTIGAATNISGYYYIINVPVGTYTVKASMMGYHTKAVQSVKVSIDLTTHVDFDLVSTVLEMGEVTVTAERPMINKEVTASLHVATSEEFENLPVSNSQQVVQLTAGVDGNSFRGGLNNEVTYMVDGVSINDPMFHTASANISLVAVKELQVTTGAYNAEYGEAMSGIVNIVTKEGGIQTTGSFEILSDLTYSQDGEKKSVFGGNDTRKYANGYTRNEFSLQGPVPFTNKKLTYFLSGNTEYADVFSPRAYKVIQYNWENPYPNGVVRESFVPHNKREDYGTNLNLSYSIMPTMKLRFKGFSNRRQFERPLYEGTSQTSERSYLFKQDDFDVTTEKTRQFQLNLTHTVNPKIFYDFRVVNFSTFTQIGLSNGKKETPFSSITDFFGDYRFRELDEFSQQDWSNPENPFGVYNKFQSREATGRIYELRKQSYWSAKWDGVAQVTQNHQLKAGLEFTNYAIRRYRNTLPWDPEPFLQMYGYQMIVDTLFDATTGDVTSVNRTVKEYNGTDYVAWLKYEPYKPWTGALYFQDSMEYPGFIVNFGLRLDAFYAYAEKRVDPYDWYSPTEKVDIKWRLSPRIGISHPISDRSMLHLFYGRFFQTPNFNDLFLNLDPYITRSYSGVGNPDLEAMKTTSYEIGLRHQLFESLAFDLTIYYKDMYDLMGTRPILAVPFNYSHQDNYDFANSKGFEFTVDKRLSHFFAARVNYSLWKRDAQIVPSFSQIAQGEVDPRTGELYPRRYRLKGMFYHSGNWQLDIVFPKDFGPSIFGFKPLSDFYISAISTMRSGNYYTRTDDKGEPVGDYYSAQLPWRFQTDLEVNKRFDVLGTQLAIFLQVINLFDRQNILTVYTKTGDPYDLGRIIQEANFSEGISRWKDDGTEHPNWQWEYVKDLDGDEKISQHEEYVAWVAADQFQTTDPSHFGTARQFRLGLRLFF